MFVNKKWSHPNSVTVKHKRYSPAVEILTVGIRPYYLSREFSHVLVTTVYVPPSADAKEAADTIASHVHDLDDRAPDAIKIITGCLTTVTSERHSRTVNNTSRVLRAKTER